MTGEWGTSWEFWKVLRNQLIHKLSPGLSSKSEKVFLKLEKLTWKASEAQPEYCFLHPTSYSLPNLLGCQVPNKPSSASYSFSGRRKVGAPSEDLSMSPGPGKYNSTNPDVYRQRQPSFSMQSRTKRPIYSSAIPGPGTYSPEKFHVHLPKPPSFTLGVRHSEFVTPLVVDVVDWPLWIYFKCLILFNFSHNDTLISVSSKKPSQTNSITTNTQIIKFPMELYSFINKTKYQQPLLALYVRLKQSFCNSSVWGHW